MTKVPFDWEVFQRSDVVIEFVVPEHMEIFVERHFEDGVPRTVGSSPDLRHNVLGKYPCRRFRNGVWHSHGTKRTYMDSEYRDYLYMVYDPALDVPPSYAEVGDLL